MKCVSADGRTQVRAARDEVRGVRCGTRTGTQSHCPHPSPSAASTERAARSSRRSEPSRPRVQAGSGRRNRQCGRRQRTDRLFPRCATATWWTNLPEDADTAVRLYHDHATCEQFHSELKTDGWRPERRPGPLPKQFIIIRATARNGTAYPQAPPNRLPEPSSDARYDV